MDQVEVFDGVAAVIAGDVLLVLWRSPASLARVRWMGLRVERLVAARTDGAVVMQLILPSSSPPDADSRNEAKKTLEKCGAGLRRLITVPLGDTLWTQVLRSMMRAMMVVLGQSHQHLIVATPREAIDRVRQLATSSTPTVSELDAAVQALYRALDAQTSSAARPA